MSARTYDPFAIERPILRLGEHGSYTLGDITDARADALKALMDDFAKLEGDEDAKLADIADLVGRLCESACIGGEGLRAKIVDLADETKHGEDVIGAKALGGVVKFIGEWYSAEASAGEG